MRNFCFTTLCLGILVFASSGCRQTNGSFGSSLFGSSTPSASTPLSPAGGTLTPVAPGQTPVLGTFNGMGPFGGSTRVSPPPTGSFAVPNNYMGSFSPSTGSSTLQSSSNVAPGPISPSSPNPNTSQAFVASDSSVPIGSGVQPAGWTETTVNMPTNPNLVGSQDISSNRRDPRAGGMQVIDLTGAPSPPGYRPLNQNFAPPTHTAGVSSGSMTPKIPRFESRTDHPNYSPPPTPSSNVAARTANADNLTWRRPGTR